MVAPAINISSDASEESVTSVVSRVILLGIIPTDIPIIPDMPTDLPTIPELHVVSPILCSNDSEPESADELPERHPYLDDRQEEYVGFTRRDDASTYWARIAAVETERELKEAEADDEADAKVQPEGTIEIGVDVAIGIDIPDDLVVPDAIERLGQLEEGMQRWLPKKPAVTLDSLTKTKARMKMITITKVKEMETTVTIMEMEIKTEGMEVQKEMHQLLGFVTIRIFFIVNQATLVTIGINESYEMPWKDLMKLMIEVYCPRIKIQQLENKLWNLCVKGSDVAGYTRRFQELTLLCPRMVPEENDKIESLLQYRDGYVPFQ
nr:reverse transcriptase domain-containing protein [Tanacetum cinerariifolium]